MTALYSLCECAIIYLTIWLNSFRIWYYKDWFKEIHSFKCTCLTWLRAWTTCFGASCPLHLLLPFPGTFLISSLTTWMNTVQRPALSSKVLSRKALWLPDRPRLPVTSSWRLSCPSPASVSFSDWLSPLKTVHGGWPSRNPTMHPWAWHWACAYQLWARFLSLVKYPESARDLNFRKCHFLVLKISGTPVNLSAVSKWNPEVTAYLVSALIQVTTNTWGMCASYMLFDFSQ